MSRVIAPFASPMLRAARAIEEGTAPPKREFSSEQKKIARHMNWNGASVEEIRDALGLDWCIVTLRKRLREINIRTTRSRIYDGHFGPRGRR